MVATDAARLSEAVSSIPSVAGRRFRSWVLADAPSLVEAWNDAQIARWNPVPAEATREAAEVWIAGASAQRLDSHGIDVVFVDRRDAVLGELGLQIDRNRRIAELGFWVAARMRGRHVATDMLGLAPDVMRVVDVDRAFALVHPGNDSALGLLRTLRWREVETTGERLGFVIAAG